MTDAERLEKALDAQTKKVEDLIEQVTALLNTMNAFLQSADIDVIEEDEIPFQPAPVTEEHSVMYN